MDSLLLLFVGSLVLVFLQLHAHFRVNSSIFLFFFLFLDIQNTLVRHFSTYVRR